MGAVTIHERARIKPNRTVKEAFYELREDALYEYGHDPYSGTIATCNLVGKVNAPANEDEYDEILDDLGKRECVYYERDGWYNFVGWAAS